jgi:hypothetical protein
MHKNKGCFPRHLDKELDAIREQQRRQYQISENRSQHYRQSWTIAVLLENGRSVEGTVAVFDNPSMPKCRVFFKGKDELWIASDVNIQAGGSEKIAALQSSINTHLLQLHEDAVMEFPQWLEKNSVKSGENNLFLIWMRFVKNSNAKNPVLVSGEYQQELAFLML